MIEQLCKLLKTADGKSEFVISLVCDIRGFSEFSARHESPDIAMFIKRFYLNLLENYFANAAFAKTTGDGLLLIFKYSESDLSAVSEYVLNACFKVINDFPLMFKNDPMVNFKTPEKVAFGVSRGPTCCLFSGKRVMDYSGQLLNLAARLNDLARPGGIVIAGSYLRSVIPETMHDKFDAGTVYVRGIAEDDPIDIFHSKDVILPYYALQPLNVMEWKTAEHEFAATEVKKISGKFILNLDGEPLSKSKSRLQFIYPNHRVSGYSVVKTISDYDLFNDASGHRVRMSIGQLQSEIRRKKIQPEDTITVRFQYVPKKRITTEER